MKASDQQQRVQTLLHTRSVLEQLPRSCVSEGLSNALHGHVPHIGREPPPIGEQQHLHRRRQNASVMGRFLLQEGQTTQISRAMLRRSRRCLRKCISDVPLSSTKRAIGPRNIEGTASSYLYALRCGAAQDFVVLCGAPADAVQHIRVHDVLQLLKVDVENLQDGKQRVVARGAEPFEPLRTGAREGGEGSGKARAGIYRCAISTERHTEPIRIQRCA